MTKFIDYPVRNPINQGNLFGANPAEYAPLGQRGHPGNDFEAPTGTKVYSPCDGTAFYVTDSLGGDGIWIRTTDTDGQNYNIILWHMPTVQPAVAAANGETLDAPVSGDSAIATATQYPFQIPTDRSMVPVKRGQWLGYTDNSGYGRESTGPHLHFAMMPCDKNWNALYPTNGYLGCVDPQPFYTGTFADEVNLVPAALAIVQNASNIVTQIKASTTATPAEKSSLLDEIKKVAQLLEEIV